MPSWFVIELDHDQTDELPIQLSINFLFLFIQLHVFGTNRTQITSSGTDPLVLNMLTFTMAVPYYKKKAEQVNKT